MNLRRRAINSSFPTKNDEKLTCMHKVSDKIKCWESLIKWFELVKEKTGAKVDDNFKIASGMVFVDGQNLQLHMTKFWLQEGLCNEDEWLRLFDLSDINCRMRLKSHLVNFLHTSHS